MPYFPYSRQSKRKTHRGAITARMLANLLNVAGVSHVITIDLHASQMQGFFKCPVDNLVAEPLLAKWLKTNVEEWWETVVVSKNPGGTKRVTSLADALKLSFGIVTTERRRPYMSHSMYNSVIFESLGVDGIGERRSMDTDAERVIRRDEGESRDHIGPLEQDFAHRHSSPRMNNDHPEPISRRRHSAARTPSAVMAPTLRTRLGNGHGDVPSSPLSRSTRLDSIGGEDDIAEGSSAEPPLRRISTALSIGQPQPDEDGYEEPAGEDDTDERARDVITGRLIQGHIVDDDDATSPSNWSTRSGSNGNQTGYSGYRWSEDEQLPDPMAESFMSVASTHSRMAPPHYGLGGTGDATASDEEEEVALKDPDVESTVTLVGNVRGKPVLIVDDMIDKAGSWIAAAETVVKRGGATKVICMATHGLFGGDCLRELEMCDEVTSIVVTDAFPIPEEKRRCTNKLVVLDVSSLLAEAIRRNHYGESISQLYQHFS